MCSIFGTNITDKEKLQQLAVAGEVRGKDATGIASIGDDMIKVTKSDVKASKLDFDKVLEGNFYLGHTRKTTQGNEEDNQNNHPFVSEDKTLLLAHNGIISNDKDLWVYETDIETDSFAVMQQLEEEKGEDTLSIENVKSVCEKLQGSFTLTIMDTSTNTLYLLRHSNPLEIMYNSETGELVYASLKKMIRNAYGNETDYGTFIGSTEENMIYEFDLDTNKFVNQLEFSPKKYNYQKRGNYWFRQNSTKSGLGKYFDEKTQEFNLNKLESFHFYTYKPSTRKGGITEYEKCDFCGIHYRNDNYVKAGIKKDNAKFCAFCWEGEQNKVKTNHKTSSNDLRKAQEVKEEKIQDELTEKYEDIPPFMLTENEFKNLSNDEKKKYIFCYKCKHYYYEDYDYVTYDEKERLHVCSACEHDIEVAKAE